MRVEFSRVRRAKSEHVSYADAAEPVALGESDAAANCGVVFRAVGG